MNGKEQMMMYAIVGLLIISLIMSGVSLVMVLKIDSLRSDIDSLLEGQSDILDALGVTPGKPYAGQQVVFLGMAGDHPRLLEEYESEFENLTGIDLVVESHPWTGLFEKGMLSLELKGTGLYDVLGVNCDWYLPSWASYLQPLNDYISKDDYSLADFIPIAMDHMGRWPIDSETGEPARFGGMGGGELTLGIPYLGDAMFMDIRMDLAEQAGLPLDDIRSGGWTIEEFEEYATTLTTEDVVGLGVEISYGHLFTDRWFGVYAAQTGTDAKIISTETFEPVFNNEEGKYATKFWKDSLGTFVPTWAIEAAIGTSEEEFKAGKAAMNLEWGNAATALLDPEQNEYANVTEIVPPPQGDAGVPMTYFAGWSYGIAKNSDVKGAAWEFIKWAASEEMQRRMAAGVPPTRISVLEDPEMAEEFPYFETALYAMRNSMANPRLPEFSELHNDLGDELLKYLTGQTTLDEAMDSAEQAVRDIMEEGGYYD